MSIEFYGDIKNILTINFYIEAQQYNIIYTAVKRITKQVSKKKKHQSKFSMPRDDNGDRCYM